MGPLLDPLFLQAGKKGFGDRIVPPIVALAHARFETVALAETSPIIAPILRPLIEMDEGLLGATRAHDLHHGIQNEFAMECRRHSPADDFAREEIHDDGEI